MSTPKHHAACFIYVIEGLTNDSNAFNTFFYKLRSCEMIVYIAKQSQIGHVIIFSELTKNTMTFFLL